MLSISPTLLGVCANGCSLHLHLQHKSLKGYLSRPISFSQHSAVQERSLTMFCFARICSRSDQGFVALVSAPYSPRKRTRDSESHSLDLPLLGHAPPLRPHEPIPRYMGHESHREILAEPTPFASRRTQDHPDTALSTSLSTFPSPPHPPSPPPTQGQRPRATGSPST